MREPLIWLGEADPVETIEKGREVDPRRLQLAVVLTQWEAVLGNRRLFAKAVVREALAVEKDRDGNRLLHPEFRSALMAVAASDRSLGKLDTQRLGKWLGRHKGSVIGNKRIVQAGILDGYALWGLQQKTEQARQGWE